jgi:hypothetical protein
LEDNPSVNISLADKRRAFDEYRAKWDTFHPIQKLERKVDNFYPDCHASGSGVHGFVTSSKKFIEFLGLDSVSRGVPRKEWKVPLPDFEPFDFAINPHADVLVAIERNAR